MKEFRKGLVDGLPIGLGYLSVSFTFGIMAANAGLSVLQAVLISALNLTSAGQFAGLQIMIAGGSLIEIALTQIIINSRYSLMSISLSQKVDKDMNFARRLFYGFFHTDEIYAVAMGHKGKVGHIYFLGLSILPFIGWTLGTGLGAIMGEILPAMISNALNVALYGMFVAIVIPKVKAEKSHAFVVLIAILLSSAFWYVPGLNKISSGFAVIICTLVAALLGAWLFPVYKKKAVLNGLQ
jgi:4-azaleucine resistance transporter AzlC